MNNPFLFQIFILLGCLLNPTFIFSQNTTCATALTITAGAYTIDTLKGEGAIFQGATAAAWYRYEPTVDGLFTVSSCNGGANTRLVIFLMDDCENPSDILIINSAEDNCTDGLGSSTASTIEVVGNAGFSYVIYWDNGQSTNGFMWTLETETVVNAQIGETCQTAEIIEDGTHQVSSLSGIGTAFSDAVSAKWYTYTPERDGALFITSCESEKNTRLFVWENGCETKNILAQDDNGCGESGASDLKNIIVEAGKEYMIYWDDHYTKEGFSFDINVMDETTSNQEPVWAKDLQVYPNPVQNQLFVEYTFPIATNLALSIHNSIGQRITKTDWNNFTEGTIAIDVNELPRGVYFLNFQTGAEHWTKKVVVNR